MVCCHIYDIMHNNADNGHTESPYRAANFHNNTTHLVLYYLLALEDDQRLYLLSAVNSGDSLPRDAYLFDKRSKCSFYICYFRVHRVT